MTVYTLALRASTALACLAACAAHAEEATPLDRIVVTGLKGSEDFGLKSGIPIDKVPQSIQVLDADDLIARGATSIGDALRAIPSASVGNSRVARYQSFSLKVRGFLVDQMRNGIRQRYYEDVDASALSNIERIEVLKGPSAVLYGQSAVGGIVSIVTKQPADKWQATIAGTFGNYKQRQFTLDLGGPVSDTLSIRLTGEVERSGTFVDFQDIDRDNIALTLRWQPAEWAVGHLVTEYVERRTRSNPGLPVVGTVVSNGVAAIPRSRFLAEPEFSDLRARSPLVQAWVDFSLGGGWTLTPRLQYSQLKTPFTEIRVRGVEADDPTQVRRTGRIGAEDDDYTIAQLDLAGSVRTGPLTHRLLAGFEFDRERSTFLQSNFVSVPSIDALNPVYLTARPETAFGFDFRQALNGYAVYFQDRIEITDAIELLGGVRQSWLNNDGYFSTDPTDLGPVDEANITSTTWQIGATWKLGHGFSLYTGYNTGFDVENVFGLRTVSGNPLPPETSNQVELGVRYGGENLRVSVAGFQIRRQDVAGDDLDNPGFSRAIGDLRVRGVEIEGDWRPLEALTLSGGYAYLRGQITGSADAAEIGGRIADVPRSTGTVRATADLGHGLELRGGVSYVGSRAVANASAVSLDDYAVADIGLGYRWRRVRLDLSINNLANARFFTVANQGNANVVYPGDPRTVSGRIAVTW